MPNVFMFKMSKILVVMLPWKLQILCVKDFPGARIRCMQDYVQPTLKEIPVGTNNLTKNIPIGKIAEPIVYLATTLKSDSCSVSISKTNLRSDKLWKKVSQINRHLNKLYKAKNFVLIDYDMITLLQKDT